MENIAEKIEDARAELNLQRLGTLEALKVSKEMDKLIVEFYKTNGKKPIKINPDPGVFYFNESCCYKRATAAD